jgi:hypothetical protein
MMRFSHLLRDRPIEGSSSASATTSFEYMPLEEDCIRIVYLHPRRAKRRAEEIECTLAHVAFGDRPKYKALSYAWENGTTKRTIRLNGINFEVGDNLAAALVNIRGLESAGEMPQAIWIDAICINQSDNAEKDRQVPLMTKIYARADMVLVWLGIYGTFEHHCSLETSIRSKKTPKHSPANSTRLPTADHEIYRITMLCSRGYWKRLWIIQEIGKARLGGLLIHYDSTTIEWDRFIEILKSKISPLTRIPLKLDDQRKGRFAGGHSLSNLLRTYPGALCKDPRDKIYGLIGLAADIRNDRFPIGYSKPLFEVFTDTIFFLNNDENRSQQFDILDMSRLVGRTLGGSMGLQPNQPARDFSAGDISLDSRTRSLRVPGWLAGRVKAIGPLHSDVVARTKKSDEWTSLIWSGISDSQLRPTVLEQSELFLEVLQRFDDVSQRTIFSFDYTITWEELKQYSIEAFEYHHGSNVGRATPQSPDSYRNGSRLFLLQPRPADVAPSWMGLAPLGTQVGDFICHIAGIERAVIIRQSPSDSHSSVAGQNHYIYQIIGCAGLARDTITARDVRGTNLLAHELFATGMFSLPNEVAHLNLYMDIRTAWDISLFC